MSQEIDERVVEMRFDNAQFERNTRQSIKTLNALNESLKLEGAEKSFEKIEDASAKVDFDKMQSALESLNSKFSAVEVMGVTALMRITNQAMDTGEKLVKSLSIDQVTWICGSAYKAHSLDEVYDYDLLPSWDDLAADKLNYARSFNVQQQNMDPITGHRLVEPYPNSVYVVQNPPSATLTTDEMDEVAELPYARDWHPDYDAAGGVPAFAEIKFSISSNRGCFGECSFCALTFHQGRVLQMRSHGSIMREAELLTRDPEFKGYINDVGGPTANFSRPACDKQLKHGVCKNKRCLWPSVCKNMVVDESGYTQLLRDLRQLPGVKKVFIRSGIRYDYLLEDKDDSFFRELVAHHVSGQLKVAPEHCSAVVLDKMGKPHIEAGQHSQRGGGACTFPQKNRHPPRAGAGFLSHPGHSLDLYVLHGS